MSPRTFKTRSVYLCLILALVFTGLSVRLFHLHLWRSNYQEESSRTYDRSEIIPGIRGNIVDRYEEVLAKSIPLSSLYVDTKLLQDPTLIINALAYERALGTEHWNSLDKSEQERVVRIQRRFILENEDTDIIRSRYLARAVGLLARPLGLTREELHRRISEPISRGRKEFPVAKDFEEDVTESLRSLISENRLRGFIFKSTIKRWYPSPELASHIIGYTGEEAKKNEKGDMEFSQVGKFGVEAAMEEFLHGQNGRMEGISLPIPDSRETITPPRHGLNVQLTIDSGLQDIVQQELDAGLEEYKSKRGCIIVLEPNSGEILAMANRPSFDLVTKKGLAQGAMNYAIQGVYEPGSTFKIVAAAAAINEKLVTPNTGIYCHNGKFVEGKLTIPDHHPYGNLSVTGVLQKSSNIGAFKLARQLGTKRFYNYVEHFGFAAKSEILLSGESSGTARNTNNLIDFSRASYGYAVNVTPLQVTMAYGAIANGGKLMKPHIVKSIIARDGAILEDFEPEIVRQVISKQTSKQMRTALATVTAPGGTATQAAVPGFKVAGKTGTARRIDKGHYQKGHYTVSFVGMMPALEPKFVCLVVIDDPLTDLKRYGGTVAAPIFAKLAPRIATHLHLEPTESSPQEEANNQSVASH